MFHVKHFVDYDLKRWYNYLDKKGVVYKWEE